MIFLAKTDFLLIDCGNHLIIPGMTDLQVGLGTDVAAGSSMNMIKTMLCTLQASKMVLNLMLLLLMTVKCILCEICQSENDLNEWYTTILTVSSWINM